MTCRHDPLEVLRREWAEDESLDPRAICALAEPMSRQQKERIVAQVLRTQRRERVRSRAGTMLVVAVAAISVMGWPVGSGDSTTGASAQAAEAAELAAKAARSRTRQKFGDSERLLQRALELRERALGPEHTLVAETLTELAELYRSQGVGAKADALYRRAYLIQPEGVF
jgi:type VI protein secretion system component VasK